MAVNVNEDTSIHKQKIVQDTGIAGAKIRKL